MPDRAALREDMEWLVPDGLGGQRLSQLPRFHFYFNIGSMF